MPECFNSPYGTKYFPEYAETISDGSTCKILKEAAEKHKVFNWYFSMIKNTAGLSRIGNQLC